MPPATVMMIRHGEKPPAFGAGVDDQGAPDDYSLAVRGWQRAGALIAYFTKPDDPIVTPELIFAATPVDKGDSLHGRRPLETVELLATYANIKLDKSFSVGSEAALAAALKNETRTTLISWEHHALTDIVAELLIPGFSEKFPNRFDLVWLFTEKKTGYQLREINQHVLPDDI